ncbi:MAG: S4 domain-containing protein [Pseudomonadota bacterium]
MATEPGEMRLDKWLWAARFFKTRELAIEAVKGGKVHLNGQRTKPGKTLVPGAHLAIHKDTLAWDIEVLVLSRQRRSAREAALMYQESQESQTRRLQSLETQRQERALGVIEPEGRPTKRNRRAIERLKQGEGW